MHIVNLITHVLYLSMHRLIILSTKFPRQYQYRCMVSYEERFELLQKQRLKIFRISSPENLHLLLVIRK